MKETNTGNNGSVRKEWSTKVFHFLFTKETNAL